MDLENQARIKKFAEELGAENLVVILGGAEAEAAGLAAETVSAGDPTFAGPLAGVSLGLPVYHILDPLLKAEADPQAWEDQISMMEMVVDTEALSEAVAKMRDEHSKFKL